MIKKTHQSKGTPYKVPKSATFKPKGTNAVGKHATHSGKSKKK
jgi:hypothetical protein